MPKETIRLGDEIEDVTSKTKGIAMGRVEYLSGAIYWILQPYTVEDNVMVRTQEIPDAYCKRVGDGVYPTKKPRPGFHVRELDDAH